MRNRGEAEMEKGSVSAETQRGKDAEKKDPPHTHSTQRVEWSGVEHPAKTHLALVHQ